MTSQDKLREATETFMSELVQLNGEDPDFVEPVTLETVARNAAM